MKSKTWENGVKDFGRQNLSLITKSMTMGAGRRLKIVQNYVTSLVIDPLVQITGYLGPLGLVMRKTYLSTELFKTIMVITPLCLWVKPELLLAKCYDDAKG